MALYIDQMGNKISLDKFPERIVSLVPSQSELLYDLGLGDRLVGITDYCIHPKQMHNSIEHVGGTKKLNIEKIRNLEPDLIIGNKEENERTQIEQLMHSFPIWMSDISNLEEAMGMIGSIAEICDRREYGKMLIERIGTAFNSLIPRVNGTNCLYLIWRKPYMAAGVNTFINNMLVRCGFLNVCLNLNDRYPEISVEQIQKLKPTVVFLSSEPFPFKQKHITELKQHLPDAQILLVDGEYFSWYGSRLLKAPEYFTQLLENVR